MSSISAGVAVQQAALQQNIAISVMKKSADLQQAVVSMIDQIVAPSSRGGNVNISA